jgi:DNA-directed RNA polymerase specialized sigma24 family protein
LISLCGEWHAAETDRQRSRVVAELWVVLNGALTRSVRVQCRSYGFVDQEDIKEIASEKSLAFLRNLAAGSRDIRKLTPGQVSSYLSVLARNGLVDVLRKNQNRRYLRSASFDDATETQPAPIADGAETLVKNEQFIRAICDCVMGLTPWARSAWFMRVFLDMSSDKIATHPDVGMTRTALDMLLSRTRRRIRDCMCNKGFNSDDAPPGTLVTLWDLLRADVRREQED